MLSRFALIFALLYGVGVTADPLRIVSTIKPLQMIAAIVGGDQVQSEVLLDPRLSPHDYQLKPSDRARLQRADGVFWVGPGLELFLQRALQSLPASVHIVALQPKGGHDSDAHIWMDPLVSAQIGHRMAALFAQLRPERGAFFKANAAQLQLRLQELDAELQVLFTGLPSRSGFLVSHDAFAGFEQRYRLRHLAAISDGHEQPPGPRHLLQVRGHVEAGEVGCVLVEPQYDPKLLDAVTRDRPIRRVSIDPMAGQSTVTVDGLLAFYREMGKALVQCIRG